MQPSTTDRACSHVPKEHSSISDKLPNSVCFCRLAIEYDAHADEALIDPESYLANPINAYLFVKKFTVEKPAVEELLSAHTNRKGKLRSRDPPISSSSIYGGGSALQCTVPLYRCS